MKGRILAVLLLSAALSLWGATWGAPDPAYASTAVADRGVHPQTPLHPDAFQFAGRAFLMAASGDWNPNFFENPSLFINLNALLHALSGAAAGHPIAETGYVARDNVPFSAYVMARVLSALAGVLLAAFTYALGRRAFGARAGELAALLVAVAPVAVQHSHYATTNVTAAALATGALWASLRLLREKAPASMCAYVGAGLLVGLAASAKYTAGVAGVAYVLVGAVEFQRRRTWLPFVAGLAAAGAGFVVGTPYAVLDSRAFWEGFQYITGAYLNGQGYPESDYGLAFHAAHLALFGLGPVGTVLALLGAGVMLRERRPPKLNSPALYAAVLLAYVGVYALVVLRARRLGDHLTIPVIGALAVCAGAGASWILDWFHARRESAVLRRYSEDADRIPTPRRVRDALPRWINRYATAAAMLVAVLVAPLFAYTVGFDIRLSRPDTRELAQAWIYAHVRRGEHVHLIGPYNVPLDPADYTTTQDFGHEYQSPAEIRASGATVVVVSDAVRFLYDSTEPFIPSALPGQVRAALVAYEDALTWVVRVERPRWFGDAWPLNTAAYFHNPGIAVYCLPEACADVVTPPE